MHHRTCKRTIGAGLEQHLDVGLFHRRRVVDVDDHDLGATLLAGTHGVGHDIDLGGDGIGAPDHHAI